MRFPSTPPPPAPPSPFARKEERAITPQTCIPIGRKTAGSRIPSQCPSLSPFSPRRMFSPLYSPFPPPIPDTRHALSPLLPLSTRVVTTLVFPCFFFLLSFSLPAQCPSLLRPIIVNSTHTHTHTHTNTNTQSHYPLHRTCAMPCPVSICQEASAPLSNNRQLPPLATKTRARLVKLQTSPPSFHPPPPAHTHTHTHTRPFKQPTSQPQTLSLFCGCCRETRQEEENNPTTILKHTHTQPLQRTRKPKHKNNNKTNQNTITKKKRV